MPRQREPGIYAIRNTATGRVYIGSTLNLTARLIGHRCALRRGDHINRRLTEDWLRYGESAFRFIVLERCPADDKALVQAEQRWIDEATPTYLYNGYVVARRTVFVWPVVRGHLESYSVYA